MLLNQFFRVYGFEGSMLEIVDVFHLYGDYLTGCSKQMMIPFEGNLEKASSLGFPGSSKET